MRNELAGGCSEYESSLSGRKSQFNKRPVGSGRRINHQSQDTQRTGIDRTTGPPRPRLAASAVRRSGHRPYPEDDQQAPTVEKSRAATLFAAFPATFAILWFSETLI